MQDVERPDAEKLLRALSSDPHSHRRGRLRVFMGMAAGVGKTYAMLQAANERLKEGVDVVIGVVETHGRQETAALSSNIPMIPKMTIEYRGTLIDEMDLDTI